VQSDNNYMSLMVNRRRWSVSHSTVSQSYLACLYHKNASGAELRANIVGRAEPAEKHALIQALLGT
jgi:hypothetical protein